MKLTADIVGEAAGPVEQTLDRRWLMAYSAGLGETDARCYDSEPSVHPLFPVCYEWPASQPLRRLPALQALNPRLIHAQHDVAIHRPLRAGETIRTSSRIVAAEQRSPGAFVVYRFETRGSDSEPVTTSDFGALYRGVQLSGEARRIEALEDPPQPGSLNLIGEIDIAATAAHVYTECARIWNPIHTDRAYARAAGLPDIILHGTATLALSISRALATFRIDWNAVRRARCRFTGMVLMPSVLSVHAARSANMVEFETRNPGGDAVIRRGQLLLQ